MQQHKRFKMHPAVRVMGFCTFFAVCFSHLIRMVVDGRMWVLKSALQRIDDDKKRIIYNTHSLSLSHGCWPTIPMVVV